MREATRDLIWHHHPEQSFLRAPAALILPTLPRAALACVARQPNAANSKTVIPSHKLCW
jgi:hypothetical protein